jgi:hypothetical protein
MDRDNDPPGAGLAHRSGVDAIGMIDLAVLVKVAATNVSTFGAGNCDFEYRKPPSHGGTFLRFRGSIGGSRPKGQRLSLISDGPQILELGSPVPVGRQPTTSQ